MLTFNYIQEFHQYRFRSFHIYINKRYISCQDSLLYKQSSYSRILFHNLKKSTYITQHQIIWSSSQIHYPYVFLVLGFHD